MNVSAILAADIHLRDSVPECRTDDFMKAQTRKHNFLKALQEKHNAPVLLAGDLFHHWKPRPFLIGYALRVLARSVIGIPGQHDLPAHSLERIEESGIYVLAQSGAIELLSPDRDLTTVIRGYHYDSDVIGFPWGVELAGTKREKDVCKIALVHHLVYQGKVPFPGAEKCGGTAKLIIKQMPGFNLIVTGDNHQTFVERVGNTVLVNPGSFMRTTAAQADHKPCVFLWDEKTNEVEQVFLPIDKKAVSRDHIEKKEDKDERIDAFVSRLSEDCEMTLSYETNMRTFLANPKNKVSKPVQQLIWDSMEIANGKN
jgi:DNA repair exonuclease SbcCD nuclease subunit